MESKTIMQNEENLKDAINNGVSGEAVTSTIEGIIENTNGNVPKQVGQTIQAIAEMKSTPNIPSDEYLSSFVNKNSEKIKAALNDGIEPEEISQTLVNQLNNSNTKQSKKKLNFIVRLVSKIKQREKRLQAKKSSKFNQKIKTQS